MSEAIVAKTNVKEEDILKYMKPQNDGAGEQPVGLAPTQITNRCSETLLWHQSWAGMVVQYGYIPVGSSIQVNHNVVWYDYSFTTSRGSIMRLMIEPGTKLVISDENF